MKKLLITLLVLSFVSAAAAELTVSDLRCEYLTNPLGVDASKPRLSWLLGTKAEGGNLKPEKGVKKGKEGRGSNGQKQTGYQVLVASSSENLSKDKGDLWDSGKVKSDKTIHIAYAGKELKSRMHCFWKVRVFPALSGVEGDKDGKTSAWSAPAMWSMGLLEPKDWGKARFIADPKDAQLNDAGAMPATMLRKSFKIDGEIKRATVHATGLGVYELRLNGKKVGDHILAPEFTCYDYRIQYQSYDVTDMIKAGDNGVGAILATGWNGEHFFGMAIGIAKNPFQGRRGFIMRLDIELANGKTQTIITDESWKSTREGPVRAGSIYDGYKYDARLEWDGWDTGDFDESLWRPVIIADYIESPKNHADEPVAKPKLVWQRNEPIRVVKEIKPVAMTEPKPGVFIIDMGQNMVGWCKIQVHFQKGTEIKVRYGEVLDKDGMLYTENLRRAAQTDTYVKRTGKMEIFEPRFTYHGFRYVEISGRTNKPWRYEPDAKRYKAELKHVIGRVLHSATPDAGTFKCSSEHINKLMDLIVWTQRGNMHSIPTDCPQRCERAGWMGDIQAFSQTAMYNMDMAAFLNKWLWDVRDSQMDDGRYPNFAPMDKERWAGGSPAWADAGTIVPWRMYQNYADVRLLEEHYESAKRWVDFVYSKNPNLLWSKARGNSFNDWLNADKIDVEGWPKKGAEVPVQLMSTAFFAKSTEIVGRMAEVLGRKEDAEKYSKRAEAIKVAFNKRYVKSDGKLEGDTQAGYAVALEFDMLPEKLRAKAAKHMVDGFKRYKGHMSTGIQTTHRLMKELSRNGYNDEAYRLVLMKEFPSWGFMMENGATTIWERWDGYVEGRGFQDPTMNSFNHWALGAVGEWVWRNVVGLNPDESQPGWKHFVVKPQPGGGLTWAKGEYKSIRGTIKVAWKLEGKKFSMDLTVPPSTTATVILPGKSTPQKVASGTHHFESK